MSESRGRAGQLLTIEEAAQRLGVTTRMIRRLTASRRLPFVKVGRLVRFRETDIAQCVDEWTVPAVGRSWSA
jgi:excisionase family DNA binding protein